MKINLISAVGDPENPKTWSGTIYNIYQELKANSNLEEAYSTFEEGIIFKFFVKCLNFYYNTYFNNSKNQMMIGMRYTYIRFLSAYYNSIVTNKSSSKHFLHFGTFGLPYIKKYKDQFHYCLIDATWNIWQSNATNIELISAKDREVIERLEVKSFNNVDHIFSISEYVKHDLINFYKISESKITVVGTGSGIIKPFFGIKDYKNKKILFVAKGRFKDKGGELVLKAFDLLLDKHPDVELSIVGQNDYKGTINHPNIKTYGFIPLNELQNLFNSHSIFLMPAINEPWGLVYIEAMLCRMPIIGINKNSFPELSNYGNLGIGIDEPNPSILSNKIDFLLSNPQIIEQKGLLAQEYALKNYTWNNVILKIISVANYFEKLNKLT